MLAAATIAIVAADTVCLAVLLWLVRKPLAREIRIEASLLRQSLSAPFRSREDLHRRLPDLLAAAAFVLTCTIVCLLLCQL